MDPRDMFNQIRSDFESHRWTSFVLAGILSLGLAAWGWVISTRAHSAKGLSARTAWQRLSPDRPQLSVLPNPFTDQQH